MEDKGPQLSKLHFQERQNMAQYAKDNGRCLEGHNQNNGQYAVVTGCKYYYLSAQNIQLMKVLFIFPNIKGFKNGVKRIQPTLGLSYLTSYLQEIDGVKILNW
jgi:hypothetical protein